VVPLFEPRFGKTDFLHDMHLTYIYEYMKFIKTLDKTIGGDIRTRMEAMSYDKYIQRITKSIRYDS
jgi:hypothetical protein